MIAIHIEKGSFSDRWVKYCYDSNLDFIEVNCYSENILEELKNVKYLFWHFTYTSLANNLFAKELIKCAENLGIICYPNYSTCWHYDNKISQKFLLESIKAPLIPTKIFYSKSRTLDFLKATNYPIVFKSSVGAGSNNVKLLSNFRQAKKLALKMFKSGIPPICRSSVIKDRYNALSKDFSIKNAYCLLGSILRYCFPNPKINLLPREKGYFYCQEFIAQNSWDTRLIVIGERCIGIRRYCRKGDFRASGSGVNSAAVGLFDKECINLAFQLARKLNMQSVAFDFVKKGSDFLVVEISYCFAMGKIYDQCPGYWDEHLTFHYTKVDPQKIIFDSVLKINLN